MALKPRRILLEHARRKRHVPYGDLKTVLSAADDERQCRRNNNAAAAYREALGQWLRLSWIDLSGKQNTSITDPHALLAKLRSGGHVDKWSFAVLQAVLSPLERDPSDRAISLLAAIVTLICSDRVSQCTPDVVNEDKSEKFVPSLSSTDAFQGAGSEETLSNERYAISSDCFVEVSEWL